MNKRPPLRLARGLTLLEMLVTLLIVSLVAAIVWQAMAQLARVERLLAQGQMVNMVQALRAEWARNAIGSLLPGAPQSNERLLGSALELRGLSTQVPQWPTPGVAILHLRLDYEARTELTTLQVIRANDSSPEQAVATPLLSWPGRKGRFTYLDHQGQWHDSWPTPTPDKLRALPKAVMLETGLPELPVLLAAPLAADIVMPSRRLLERL